MNKYKFSKVGKLTSIAIIEAENFEEAMKKFGEVDDFIPSFKKFEKHYITGLYEVYINNNINSDYIIHSTREI